MEKYKLVNVALIKKCKSLDEDYTRAANSFSCVTKLEKTNGELFDKLEKLSSKHVKLQDDHIELLSSHERLEETHAMLKIAHEVMVTMVKSSEPQTHQSTSSHAKIDISCANPCCSRASNSWHEQVLAESDADLLKQENEELKQEVEKIKMDFSRIRGKGISQPS